MFIPLGRWGGRQSFLCRLALIYMHPSPHPMLLPSFTWQEMGCGRVVMEMNLSQGAPVPFRKEVPFCKEGFRNSYIPAVLELYRAEACRRILERNGQYVIFFCLIILIPFLLKRMLLSNEDPTLPFP